LLDLSPKESALRCHLLSKKREIIVHSSEIAKATVQESLNWRWVWQVVSAVKRDQAEQKTIANFSNRTQ